MTNAHRPFCAPHSALAFAALAVFTVVQAHAAPLAISQVPMYLGGTVEPNIMFIIDDSGSMTFSYMPQEIESDYSAVYAKSSHYNKIYYNPNVVYTPPVREDGTSLGNASFTAAWWNGYSSTRATSTTEDLGKKTAPNPVNLSTSFRPTWGGILYNQYGGNYRLYSGSAEPAYYYTYNAANSGCNGQPTTAACYTKVVVSSTSGPGNTDERVNFANWYSYYRTRMYLSKAAISKAFAAQGSGMRVGFGQINQGYGTIDDVNTSTLVRGVRDFSATDTNGNPNPDRKKFFDLLFGIPDSATGTPLRTALDDAGQYFKRKDSKGPYRVSPGVGGAELSCRQNYAILMTDGYWTYGDAYRANTSDARKNQDGTDGPLHTDTSGKTGQFKATPPFSDTHDNTLADVAAYYWKNDLRTDLDNNVPTNSDDPAFWQHMVTFGVGLGVSGDKDPTATFAAIISGADPNWSDPDVNSDSKAKIDDLLHAAVNSRGQFFSAADPKTFSDGLAATLSTINARTSSAAAVAANSTQLHTDSLVFQARFDSSNWSGDMLAFEIDQQKTINGKENPNYLNPKTTPKWQASKKIPLHAGRTIFTYNPTSKVAVNFSWSALNTTQQAALGNSDIVEWVRGDQSKEVLNGGTLRNRTSIMGDVVNSNPAHAGADDYGYALAASLSSSERAAYRTRRVSSTFLNRKGVLLFGANDGIFRGIDSATGSELFGYVPNSILSALPSLTSTNYTHRYFVDGSPRVADAMIGGDWKTVVISSTGAGGKGYFAIALDDLLDSTNRKLTAGDILWEISDTTTSGSSQPYAELGSTIGQAAIGRTQSGQWVAIIGNGYNSTSQTARLFVIDLATGNRLLELDTGVGSVAAPNGMATPLAVDADQDGSIDLVYAGDLYGNLWKFDFTSETANSWSIAFGGKPLFKAEDGNGKAQPITLKPTAGLHPDGGLMVYFGTGKYIETGDNTNLSGQTIYGIRDECGLATSGCTASGSAKVRRSNLLQQTIEYQGTQSFNGNSWDIRQFSQNKATTAHRGFYVDLVYQATLDGERVLVSPILWSDRVIFVTAIPGRDVCSGGGESWIIELSPYTGARTEFSVFDLARDGTYGTSSQYNKKAVNGRKVIGGMINGVGQLDAAGGKTAKIGSTASTSFDTSVQLNDGGKRISWRQVQ